MNTLPRLGIRSIRLWLLLSHLLVLLLPLALLALGPTAVSWLRGVTEEDIRHQGALWTLAWDAEIDRELLHNPAPALLDDVVLRGAQSLQRRLPQARDSTLAAVRLVDARGVVIASSAPGAIGDDLNTSPEVHDALRGVEATAVHPRPDSKLRSPMRGSRNASIRVHVALPLLRDGHTVGAVVLSRTPRAGWDWVLESGARSWLTITLWLSVTLLLALWGGRRFSRSLDALARWSQHTADGGTDAPQGLDSHVAEIRVLAHAMERMRHRLRERMTWVSEFAAQTSHEFKTPVTTLRGTLELLRDDDEMDPRQRARFLENGLLELDRLARLSGGLLALARAEEQRGEREPVDLDALAQRIADASGGVTVEGEAGVVPGDTRALETALRNLVDNAVRHRRATVTIRCWREGASAGWVVEDDGPGVPEDHRNHIFDRFFTTERARGGTGLGLAIVQAITRAHGGGVVLEAPFGAGAKFRVVLPR